MAADAAVAAATASPPPPDEEIGVLRTPAEHPLLRRPDSAVLPDGTRVLTEVAGVLEPLPPSALHLDEYADIELHDRRRWIVLDYAGSDGLRWVQVAHKREEIDRREALFAIEAAKLSPACAANAIPLRVLATVSSAEGSFDGIATHPHDRAASLGIFQWATTRTRTHHAGSSLARFFSDLRRRARATRDPCAALAAAAWKECDAAGLTMRGDDLLLDGHAATGEAIERALGGAMGREGSALRTYQLVAASDWVRRIAALRVGAGHATVGSLLRTDRALATAVLLGVNRPAWVVPSMVVAIARLPPRARRAMRERHRLDAGDERVLERELRRAALAQYRPYEREARAMRLLTSENGW